MNDLEHLAAGMAGDLRPLVQAELMKSYLSGLHAALAIAKNIAESADSRADIIGRLDGELASVDLMTR